jgi:hypothetical protein
MSEERLRWGSRGIMSPHEPHGRHERRVPAYSARMSKADGDERLRAVRRGETGGAVSVATSRWTESSAQPRRCKVASRNIFSGATSTRQFPTQATLARQIWDAKLTCAQQAMLIDRGERSLSPSMPSRALSAVPAPAQKSAAPHPLVSCGPRRNSDPANPSWTRR